MWGWRVVLDAEGDEAGVCGRKVWRLWSDVPEVWEDETSGRGSLTATAG